MHRPIPTLVITGPVGVGKTTTAMLIAEHLEDHGLPYALIDLDWMRWCRPAPPDDPFHTELGLHNLESIWQNYHRHGAARLILVDVVESRAMLDAYRRAIPGALVTLVRLHAALATIHGRLQQREQGSGLAWHRQRASELSAQMERDALEDLRIETTGKEALAVAHEILQRTQWMPA